MSPRQEATAEQIIAAAKELVEASGDNPLALSPLPVTEGCCAWLNTGLLHVSYSDRDQEEIVGAIVAQALAAMMLDGYQVVKP